MSFSREITLYPKVATNKKHVGITAFAGVNVTGNEEYAPIGEMRQGYNVTVGENYVRGSFGVGQARVNGNLFTQPAQKGRLILDAFFYQRYDYATKTRKDRLVYFLDNKDVCGTDFFGDLAYGSLGFHLSSEQASFVNFNMTGKDCLVAYDDNGMCYLFDGEKMQSSSEAPKLTSACYHDRRVFGTVTDDCNKIAYSVKYNPIKWTEADGAGRITLPDDGGVVRRLVSFNGYLYVFRDYAVYKLTSYNNMRSYSIVKVFSGMNKVYAETVACSHSKMYFLTDCGFYEYDGSKFSRIWQQYFPLLADKTYANAIVDGDKYYLACGIEKNGETVGEEGYCQKNNGILVVNLYCNEFTLFRGADVKRFVPVNYENKRYVYLVNNSPPRTGALGMITDDGKMYRASLKKLWKSPFTVLGGDEKEKIVRKVRLLSSSAVTLKVKVDEKEKTFVLTTNDKKKRNDVDLCGTKVGITVETQNDTFLVDGFEIDYETSERRNYGRN